MGWAKFLLVTIIAGTSACAPVIRTASVVEAPASTIPATVDPDGPSPDMTSNFEFTWGGTFGGTGVETANGGHVVDSSGAIIVAGSFNSSTDFDPGAGSEFFAPTGHDAYVSKFSAAGVFEWGVQISSTGSDQIYSIAVDADDAILVAGFIGGAADFQDGAGTTTITPSGTASNTFIAKYSTNGILLWAKNLPGALANPLAITTLSDNSFLITGYKTSSGGGLDFDPGAGTSNFTVVGNTDGWFAKYDSNGDFVFVKQIAGAGGSVQPGKQIIIDSNDQIVIFGNFTGDIDFDPGVGTTQKSSTGILDTFIAFYDLDGDFIGVNTMTAGPGMTVRIMGVGIQSDGSIICGIMFNGTVDVAPGADTENVTAAGAYDTALFKLNSSFELQWVKKIGQASATVMGGMISIFDDDSFLVAGVFNGGSVDFDPSGSTSLISSESASDDMFFSRFDADGEFLWAKSLGGAGNETYGGLPVVLPDGSVYVSFKFNNQIDFDPDAGTQTLGSAPGTIDDVFFGKFN